MALWRHCTFRTADPRQFLRLVYLKTMLRRAASPCYPTLDRGRPPRTVPHTPAHSVFRNAAYISAVEIAPSFGFDLRCIEGDVQSRMKSYNLRDIYASQHHIDRCQNPQGFQRPKEFRSVSSDELRPMTFRLALLLVIALRKSPRSFRTSKS